MSIVAAMSGFRTELEFKIRELNGDFNVVPQRKSLEGDITVLKNKLLAHDQIFAVASIVEKSVLISSDQASAGVLLRGVEIRRRGNSERCALCSVSIDLADKPGELILGVGIARNLGVGIGDTVRLTYVAGENAVSKAYPVSYLVDFKMSEYNSLAFMNLNSAQEFLKKGDEVDAYAAWFQKESGASERYDIIRDSLGRDFIVSSFE